MAVVGVVHDGIGEHVRELAVELAAVDDPLGRHQALAHGEPDTASVWIASRQGHGRLRRCPVPGVDRGLDALEVLRL